MSKDRPEAGSGRQHRAPFASSGAGAPPLPVTSPTSEKGLAVALAVFADRALRRFAPERWGRRIVEKDRGFLDRLDTESFEAASLPKDEAVRSPAATSNSPTRGRVKLPHPRAAGLTEVS